MKTAEALQRAGGLRPLADLLGITPSAISQWGENVPDARIWQLRVLRPDWFKSANDEHKQRA
jgi:transcriptional repressor of cell division inhibition gene dicB